MKKSEHKCYNCGNVQDKSWQFCHKCLTNLYSSGVAIYTVNTPNWVNLQKSLLNKHGGKMSPKEETKMQDMIESEKRRELMSSKSALSWEEGRKREWKANKKYYLKNGGRFT
jgi:hypothetical protein